MSEPLSTTILESGEHVRIEVRDGSGKNAWGTYRVTDHALHRVTSPLVPLRSTREHAELDFVHYCLARHDDPRPLRELVERYKGERDMAQGFIKLLADQRDKALAEIERLRAVVAAARRLVDVSESGYFFTGNDEAQQEQFERRERELVRLQRALSDEIQTYNLNLKTRVQEATE